MHAHHSRAASYWDNMCTEREGGGSCMHTIAERPATGITSVQRERVGGSCMHTIAERPATEITSVQRERVCHTIYIVIMQLAHMKSVFSS